MSDLFAVVNDLIGGWDVSEYDKTVGDHGEGEWTIGTFISEEWAKKIARSLTIVAAYDKAPRAYHQYSHLWVDNDDGTSETVSLSDDDDVFYRLVPEIGDTE